MSATSGPFGTRRPRTGSGRSPAGLAAAGLWDALDQVREAFEQRSAQRRGTAPRMGRGDVRAAVLATLADEPMHGYQIIRAIEERSGGAWKPSPGSVYPTLQALADEGLVTAQEADGKKTYSITEAGRAEAASAPERGAPWATPGRRIDGGAAALPKAGAQLAQAAAQIAHGGTDEEIADAVAVLDEARRKLYAILARS